MYTHLAPSWNKLQYYKIGILKTTFVYCNNYTIHEDWFVNILTILVHVVLDLLRLLVNCYHHRCHHLALTVDFKTAAYYPCQHYQYVVTYIYNSYI